MKSNFNKCFQFLLVDEGGYTNDISDSGGATKYGITIGDYRKYIDKNGTPKDVKALTEAQAKNIYKSKYWDAVGGDDLSAGVDNAAFNYGVLAGIGRPRMDLKKFAADAKFPDKEIDEICDEMQAFLLKISATGKNTKFRKGWLNRVKRLRKNSHAMAGTKPSVDTPTVATGAASGITLWAGMYQYFHQHTVAITIAAVLATILIGTLVHMYRNK